MERKSPKSKSAKPADTRQDRLKRALKTNLAKRKAQARARKPGETSG